MAGDNTELSADSLRARIRANWLGLALAALGFAPLLWVFFVMSWTRPAYQFFPMALFAAGALGWRVIKQQDLRVVAGDLWLARSLALVTGLTYLLANILWSPWLGYVAFLLGLVAALWSLGGLPLLKVFVPVGLMLAIILPPPLNGDVTLTVWLRTVAVHTSSSLLDWLQVTHAQDGNTLLLPGKTLLVEEACSGINSFILCNAFCLFWGLWQRRSPVWFLFALPVTSVFVVVGNVIRITVGAAANYFRHVDLLSGRPHEILGLVLLLGYCTLILSFDQLLVFLTKSDRQLAVSEDQKPAPTPPSTLNPPLSTLQSPPSTVPKFASLFLALVGMAFLAAHLVLGGRHGLAKMPSLSSIRQLNLTLPASVAGWERINADAGDLGWVQTLGVRSSDWHFQHNGIRAIVAMDYPLDGFHNVKGCYLGMGWQVLAEKELLLPPSGEDLHAIKLELQKSLQHALVLHSVVNGQGGWLSAPLNVSSRFANTVGSMQTGYRVQMISAGYQPLSPAAEADCQALFLQARQLLLRQLLDQSRNSAVQ